MNDVPVRSCQPRSCPRSRHGVRAALASLLLAIGVFAGGALLGPSSASAYEAVAMERNALADETSGSAKIALTALEQYQADGSPEALNEFLWWRTITARFAARQLGYPEFDMIKAWRASPLAHQHAILAAMSQVGVPYRSHSSVEGVGFDCSGLTTYAWGRAGVGLFRQSGTQIREAVPLERETAKAGDLVHYPGHVMIYLGIGDAIIHSVHSGRTVEVDTISERRRNSVRWGDPTV